VPFLDDDSFTLVASREFQLAYIMPFTGSATAESRQQPKPLGPLPRSRVIKPAGPTTLHHRWSGQ
jgi:hypothetical protein